MLYTLSMAKLSVGAHEGGSNPSNFWISPSKTKNKYPEEIFAVHYSPAVDRKSQILRLALVQNDDTNRLAKDWCNKVEISEPCLAYCDEILDAVARFLSVRDDQLGRISVAKHRIKPLNNNTQPAHLALYRAGQKTRRFEKTGDKKKLNDNIFDPAQTE